MNKHLSTYLDAVRFFAAAVVFLSHLSWERLSGGFLWQLQPFGHDAVIVFFVLSGFVIAYTAREKDRTFRDYAVNRLARLYSVALPALALAFVLDRIGSAVNPSVYLMDRETMPLVRLLAAATFTSQSWFLSVSALCNDAYWSLPYEAWYYVMFGCLAYLTGTTRVVALFIAAAIAGPKILLLLPVWALGAATYHLSRRATIGPKLAKTLFIGSLAAAALLAGRPSTVSDLALLPPDYSWVDSALGVAIALNILAASKMKIRFGAAGNAVRSVAGYTFSLYLFHLPLLHFAAAMMPLGISALERGLVIGAFALTGVYLLGGVTEKKKHLAKQLIERLMAPVGRPVPRAVR